jgi:hypothetical protein
MFALIDCVSPTRIAGVQKPWMALDYIGLMTWIPAIHAGMTELMSFKLYRRRYPKE